MSLTEPTTMIVVLLLQVWSWIRHFNHNDIFHVIEMLGLALLCRGGLLLEDAA